MKDNIKNKKINDKINDYRNNMFKEIPLIDDNKELNELNEYINHNNNISDNDIFDRYNRFKTIFDKQLNNNNSIFDFMRFNFDADIDNDDDRSDKYYSPEQKSIIEMLEKIKYVKLEDQIEMAITYIIDSYNADKLNYNYNSKVFKENLRNIMNNLSLEESFRVKKDIILTDKNYVDAYGIEPTLMYINLLAESFKNEIKFKFITNYDFYNKIFK